MLGLTIEVLQTTMNITDEQLNLIIQETYLCELAACFDNTDDYVEKLGLSDAQQTDVKEEKAKAVIDRTQAGMKLALKYWLKKTHLEATFHFLLSLILPMNKGNVAVKVCKFLCTKRTYNYTLGVYQSRIIKTKSSICLQFYYYLTILHNYI